MIGNLSDYMTIRQAAEELGLSRERVQKILQLGEMKFEKFGNQNVIPSSEVARLRRERENARAAVGGGLGAKGKPRTGGGRKKVQK